MTRVSMTGVEVKDPGWPTGAARSALRPLALLHQDAGPAALTAFRSYVFAIWLIIVVSVPIPRLAVLPAGYYQSVGIMMLVPSAVETWLRSMQGLSALKGALVLTCLLSIWPRTFRFAALPAAFLLLVYQSLARGYIHPLHEELVLLLAAIIFAVFELFPKAPPSPGRNPAAVPLIALALAMTLAYSMLGIERIYQGVSALTGHSIHNWVASRSLRTTYIDFNVGVAAVQWAPAAWALRLGFPLVTLLEVLAPLVLVSRRFRILFVAVMVPFHLATFVLMEVSFMTNLLLLPVVVDFSGFRASWRAKGA